MSGIRIDGPGRGPTCAQAVPRAKRLHHAVTAVTAADENGTADISTATHLKNVPTTPRSSKLDDADHGGKWYVKRAHAHGASSPQAPPARSTVHPRSGDEHPASSAHMMDSAIDVPHASTSREHFLALHLDVCAQFCGGTCKVGHLHTCMCWPCSEGAHPPTTPSYDMTRPLHPPACHMLLKAPSMRPSYSDMEDITCMGRTRHRFRGECHY